MSYKNDPKYWLLYLIRASLPKSRIFYYIFVVSKLIPIVILTHNISTLEDNIKSIYSFLIKVTLFSNGTARFRASYWIVTILITAILTLVFFSFFILFALIKRDIRINQSISDISMTIHELGTSNHKMRTNDSTSSYGRKRMHSYVDQLTYILVKTWTLFCCFLMLISTFLIEYNSLGIIQVFHYQKYLAFDPNIIYLIFVWCIFNFIILVIYNYIFIEIISTSSFSYSIGQNENVMNLNIKAEVFISSCIGFYTCWIYGNIWNQQNEDSPQIEREALNARFYLNIVALVILSFHLLLEFRKYNYYNSNFLLKIKHCLFYICFNSGITEIVLKYITTTKIHQFTSIIKLTLEIINGVLLMKVQLHYIQKYHLNSLSRKIFDNKSKINEHEFGIFFENWHYIFLGKKRFCELGSVFNYHWDSCLETICDCKDLIFGTKKKEWWNTDINGKIVNEEQWLVNDCYEDIWHFTEKELKSSIYNLFNDKDKGNTLQMLVLLHVDYIWTFQKEKKYALYLCEKYWGTGYRHLFSFSVKYFLFEYKRMIYEELSLKTFDIIEIFKSKDNVRKLKKSVDGCLSGNYIYVYMIFLNKITELLKECLSLLLKIIDFRNIASMNSKNINPYYLRSENFISLCVQNNSSINQWITILKSIDFTIIQSDISYMLTSFFNIWSNSIPKEVQHKFMNIDKCSEACSRNINAEYININTKSPLICFNNSSEEFTIKYISTAICRKWQYTMKEILNMNVNKLYPELLREYHYVLLKKFALFADSPFKKSTLILTKSNYLLNIHLEARTLPTISEDLGIIFSIDFIGGTNDIITSTGDEKTLTYYLLLGADYSFISMNELFKEEFFFNTRMWHFLNINFPWFFGVDDILKKKNAINQINTMNKQFNYNCFEEENKAISIFSPINYRSKLLKDRSKIKISSIETIKDISVFCSKIEKRVIWKNIDNIYKILDKLGWDPEWYTFVKLFRERMKIPLCSNHLHVKYISHPYLGDLSYILVTMKESIHIASHMNAVFFLKNTLDNININYCHNKGSNSNNLLHFSSGKKKVINTEDNKTEETNNIEKIKVSEKSIQNLKMNPTYIKLDVPLTESESIAKITQTSGWLNLISETNQSKISTNRESSWVQSIIPNDNTVWTQSSVYTTNCTINNNKNRLSTTQSMINSSWNGSNNNMMIRRKKMFEGEERNNRSNDDWNASLKYIDLSLVFNHEKSSKYLKYLYQILFLVVILLTSFNFIYCQSVASVSHGLFDVINYSVLIKSDIYFISLVMFEICNETEHKNTQEISLHSPKIPFRAKELFDHFTKWTQKLNNWNTFPEINKIFNLFDKEYEYDVWWNTYILDTKKSTLNEEILLLHYHLNVWYSNQDFTQCRIKDWFAYQKYKDFHEDIELRNTPLTSWEQLVYYIFTNVMSKFKVHWEDLIRLSNNLLIDYNPTLKFKILWYNSFVFASSFTLGWVLIAIWYIDKRNLKMLIMILYRKSILAYECEMIWYTLRCVVEDYSMQTCLEFEKMIFLDFLPKANTNISANSTNTPVRNITESKFKNQSQKVIIQKDGSKKASHSLFKKNRISSSQSLQKGDQFENENENKNNNNRNNNNNNNNNEENNTHILGTFMKESIITPKAINNSIISVVISIILLILVEPFQRNNILQLNKHLLPRSNSKSGWVTTICRNIHDIQRSFFITVEESEYNSWGLINYYDITIDTKKIKVFEVLKNSQYAFWYYKNLVIKEQIEIFLQENVPHYWFHDVLDWERFFSTDTGFCNYGSLGFEFYNQTEPEVPFVFNKISDAVNTCKTIGNGIALNSLTTVIDWLTKEVTKEYMDFTLLEASKRDIFVFLNRNIFLNSDQMLNGPMKRVQNTFIFLLGNDIERVYNQTRFILLVFSLSLVGYLVILYFYVNIYWMRNIEDKYVAWSKTKSWIDKFEKVVMEKEWRSSGKMRTWE